MYASKNANQQAGLIVSRMIWIPVSIFAMPRQEVLLDSEALSALLPARRRVLQKNDHLVAAKKLGRRQHLRRDPDYDIHQPFRR